MKKKISVFTIIFVVLSAFIPILALFNAVELKGTVADLLFTFLTLSVAGILTLNSCTMLERKNKLAIISLSLISASALLVIIALWSTASSFNAYMNITLTLCILSVCFNLVTSNILKLQNKYLIVQISSYACFAVISIFLISASWGSSLIANQTKLFILFLILSLLGIGILSVLSKKQSEAPNEDKGYIKIAKKEYEELLNIKALYTELKREKND